MVISNIFNSLNNQNSVAWINCVECITPKILYERALNQWFNPIKCDSMEDFVVGIQNLKPQKRFLVA